MKKLFYLIVFILNISFLKAQFVISIGVRTQIEDLINRYTPNLIMYSEYTRDLSIHSQIAIESIHSRIDNSLSDNCIIFDDITNSSGRGISKSAYIRKVSENHPVFIFGQIPPYKYQNSEWLRVSDTINNLNYVFVKLSRKINQDSGFIYFQFLLTERPRDILINGIYKIMPNRPGWINYYQDPNPIDTLSPSPPSLPTTTPNAFIDSRDNKTYKTVKIGNQTWMAENLAYRLPEGCWAYNNDWSNSKKIGYLYNWDAALKACPKDWHLPSEKEWNTLINFLGGNDIAGGKLKSESLWKTPNKGATNESGFSALPSGYYSDYKKVYDHEYISEYWWSSTSDSKINCIYYDIYYDTCNILKGYGDIRNGLSVRCIKDDGLCINTEIVLPVNNKNNDSIRFCDWANNYGWFKGEIVDGKANGYGIFKYNNGDIFTGYYQANKKNGKGIYNYFNKENYEGQYKDDKKNGYGVATFPNGGKYSGNWRDNMKNGIGIDSFPNGETYKGEYRDDTINGQGTLTLPNMDKYVGEWKDGKRNGHGIFTRFNVGTYDGNWKDDKQDGYGEFIYLIGGNYKGYWSNNMHNGEGVSTSINNSILDGFWRDNSLWDGQYIDSNGNITRIKNGVTILK